MVDYRIELVGMPVSDVDRAKEFYVDKVGFHVDLDHQVTEELRFVQLTPPGLPARSPSAPASADMAPGSQKGVQCVVADADAIRAELVGRGVDASEVDDQPWGRFVYFADPDGNSWAFQELPDYSKLGDWQADQGVTDNQA